jgi:hypothetical protein
MTRFTFFGRLIAVSACWIMLGATAEAGDIDGAWATDGSSCTKVFSKRPSGIVFSKTSDVYGGGFIIDGSRIIGRQARCQIKARKQSGATIHLVASCADDVVLSDVRMSLKVIDQNRVARLFPEIGDMEVSYDRCAF